MIYFSKSTIQRIFNFCLYKLLQLNAYDNYNFKISKNQDSPDTATLFNI